MIWNTGALSLLLASSSTAINVGKFLEHVKLKEKHEHELEFLRNRLSREQQTPYTETKENRALLENTNFLNWVYYSDDSCTAVAFGYSGIGAGACIPDGDGVRSFKYSCSGPQSTIAISQIEYGSTDCSGTPTSTQNGVIDGTCDATRDDDDRSIFDDRFADDWERSAGSLTLSCDASPAEPSFVAEYSYDDSTCDNYMTGYFGIQKGGCIPLNITTGWYATVTGKGCSANYFSDDTCATSRSEPDDDDDDDDDVGDDDFTANGKCNEYRADDDYYDPGYYYIADIYCDDSKSDKKLCFAGSETVLLESGESIPISDVKVGDMVQVASSDGTIKFSEVVFLPHRANTDRATFTELQMKSGNSLRATPHHFIMAGVCGADAFDLMAMKYVSQGSCVQTVDGEDEVVGIRSVIDHGVYTMVTKESSGLIVVNGVRASSFAVNHWFVNKYYNIHRFVYDYAPYLMVNRDIIAANLIVGDLALSL